MTDNKTDKKEVKSSAKKIIVKKPIIKKPEQEIFVGKSKDFSFKKALKNALLQVGKLSASNCKYEVINIQLETAANSQDSNLFVTIKRIAP